MLVFHKPVLSLDRSNFLTRAIIETRFQASLLTPLESTINLSKHRWWKPHKQRPTRSHRRHHKNMAFATLSSPIQVFYTLTKIQKPFPVRRPIISGCDRPTEKVSPFVDTLLQPIAQKQQSNINGYNWFHQFYRKNKDRQRNNFSIDVILKYIPQEE